MDNLPKDPVLLLSVVNTELRDYYPSLDALCEDRQVKKDMVIDALKGIDYEYDEAKNQFV
ncbi:MAG: DUF4250 domain-containing protein [Dorea sp.]|nr:DUF4250 domain-containing protein [Dorea sp.]